MNQSVFFETEFVLLVIFSVFIPVGIYGFLYKKFAISRWTVLGFAILLLVVAGIDVVLLQKLSEMAKKTGALLDNKVFLGELSLALYLFPAGFAGLGVNLLSHVLVNHLNRAEREFDKLHGALGERGAGSALRWPRGVTKPEGISEGTILLGSAVSIAAIFVLDLVTGANIRLHVLYILPLALMARYCAGLRLVIAVLFVTITLQIIKFSVDAVAITSFITDVLVALAASLVVLVLGRTSRNSYLVAINQAVTDPLTNLSNRRAFMAEVESEIVRQKRYGGSFSLAVLDLDGFKSLNDSKGHTAGDRALKLAAEILLDCTRESDSVGRVGGDEFAVLLPNTQDVDCGFLFQKLCAAIEERMAAAGFSITASIGCRTFRGRRKVRFMRCSKPTKSCMRPRAAARTAQCIRSQLG